jgi:NAD(P)-dependent dehydrogenase (short-subunit alcohol dehydrogenase family)
MNIINTIKQLIGKTFLYRDIDLTISQDLSNKVVIVTGGNKGIGKAICDVLHAQGAKIATISPHIKKDSFANYKTNELMVYKGDVSNPVDCKQFIDKTVTKFGKVDVLINNAGVFLEKPLEEISVEEYDKILDTNLKSIFLTCKYLLPYMKKEKRGTIINIGSKISRNSNVLPNKVLYATTKYAVEGFTQSLSNELKKFGIRAICILPATVNTFVSFKSRDYLDPHRIGQLISFIIKADEIDFEPIVIKSKFQSI